MQNCKTESYQKADQSVGVNGNFLIHQLHFNEDLDSSNTFMLHFPINFFPEKGNSGGFLWTGKLHFSVKGWRKINNNSSMPCNLSLMYHHSSLFSPVAYFLIKKKKDSCTKYFNKK